MVPSESPFLINEADGDGVSLRLALYDQCQAYAALQPKRRDKNGRLARQWKLETIARAFGVSYHSISEINRCLTTQSEPKRYQKVAEEWRARGEAEFMRRYYNEALHDKLVAAKHDRS